MTLDDKSRSEEIAAHTRMMRAIDAAGETMVTVVDDYGEGDDLPECPTWYEILMVVAFVACVVTIFAALAWGWTV